MGPARGSEFAALSERMIYLQTLRVGFATIALVSALLAPTVVGADVTDLTLATAAYIAVAAGAELIRQIGRGRMLFVIAGMLIIDGVFLAWVMYSTGGTDSPLAFLVYVHLIAVTLVASYRTGLKIALWHSLLFFVGFYAQAADLIEPTGSAQGVVPGSPEFTRVSVFNVTAFWIVALAAAAFSALNERELRRSKDELESLSRMAAQLKEEAKPETVAFVLLDALRDTFGFQRGLVVLRADDRVSTLAFRGPGDPPDLGPAPDPILETAWGSGGTQLVRKLDGARNPGLARALPFSRDLVVMPLLGEGDPLGAVVAEYPSRFGGRIGRRVVAMVEQFAAHGALALRNSLLMKEVQTLADTDALTSLANRRTFQAALEREFARSARSGEPVTLVMLDVDHFKRFNDAHGHQAGDEILRKVGHALAEASREFDIPARYGGEEFAVILPNCSARESLVVAERLRDRVCAIDGDHPITASAGVATFPTHASDVASLIRAADEALYESKRAGRNRMTRSTRDLGPDTEDSGVA